MQIKQKQKVNKRVGLKELRIKRSRHWQFQNSLQDRQVRNDKSIGKMMHKHNATESVNDNLVQNSLNKQNEILMKKLKERRERSFSRSINSRSTLSMIAGGASRLAQKNELKGRPIFESKKEKNKRRMLGKLNSPNPGRKEEGSGSPVKPGVGDGSGGKGSPLGSRRVRGSSRSPAGGGGEADNILGLINFSPQKKDQAKEVGDSEEKEVTE